MSKDLSTMTALINNADLHNRRCTRGVDFARGMSDTAVFVVLADFAHQQYYIIINRLSQAEMAKSVSHNNFARSEEASVRTSETPAAECEQAAIINLTADPEASQAKIGSEGRSHGDAYPNRIAFVTGGEWTRVRGGERPLRRSSKNGNTVGAPCPEKAPIFNFTRKSDKGGCDGLKFSVGGYNCVVNGTHGINPKWRRAHGLRLLLSSLSRPLSLSRSGARSRFTLISYKETNMANEIKEKQSKLRHDLIAVTKIRNEVRQMSTQEVCKLLGIKYNSDVTLGGSNSQARVKLFHKRVKAELNLAWVARAPALPPWFTFIRPKAKSEVVEKLKEGWYKKSCIDCGDIFETCNKERACCDVCHDIRVAHGGYKDMVGVTDDGVVNLVNPKVTIRK